jgi:parvulin-like peptidyl-prolyl isomerase
VVVTFHGAEDAPESARPKSAALVKAKELATLATTDFAAAVKQGDRGSMEDAGSVPQGVLEPALEYALFTLKKGQVYGEPLESPRGYWVVRRRD